MNLCWEFLDIEKEKKLDLDNNFVEELDKT
jgi:hypothetical protein